MLITVIAGTILITVLIFCAVRREKYRRSHETLQRLMGHMRMGYCRYRGQDEVVVDINEGFIDVLELALEPKDVKGRMLVELFVSMENREEMKRQISMRGFVKNAEQKVRLLNGKDKHIRFNSYAVKDDSGGKEAVEMLIEDITDEKLSKEKVIESRERYEKLFKNSGDMVIICSLEGFVIEEVNSAVEVITGFSREELGKRQMEALIHPARRKEIEDARKDLMFVGTGRLETVIVCKNGSYKDVIMTLSAVEIGDEKIVMVVIKDVSAIKKDMEETTRRNRELEDFWKASIEREERITELKQELERLREQIKFLKEKYGER